MILSRLHLQTAFVTTLLYGLSTQQSAPEEYEFIVIGSGAGGGPLAANLARAGHTVLLLEAGTDNGDLMLQRVPSL